MASEVVEAPKKEATATQERVKTGIYGLDPLVEGGVRDKTANVIVGSAGTGKTTFVLQLLRHGLELGEQGLYITLEESPDQILAEADAMGFDLRPHVDKGLFFIHLRGRNFKKMIEEQLPALVRARADYKLRTRVVVDPMTPVIWATEDKLEQRELIGKLFYTLKDLGVLFATVEEHARPGETAGEDVLLPMYLADGVVHLEYYPVGGAFNRTLKLLKMRATHHGEGVYPYLFVRGVGVVVRASAPEAAPAKGKDHAKALDEALSTAAARKAPPALVNRLKAMKANWDYDYSPEEIVQVLFEAHGLG